MFRKFLLLSLLLIPLSAQATIDIANHNKHLSRSTKAGEEYLTELTPLFPVVVKISNIIGAMQPVNFNEIEIESQPNIELIQPLISKDVAEKLSGKGGYDAYPVIKAYVEEDLLYNDKKKPVDMQQRVLNATARSIASAKEGLKFAKVSEALSNKGYEESKTLLKQVESASDIQHKFAQESNLALYGLRKQQILNLIMAKRLENIASPAMRKMFDKKKENDEGTGGENE